jgi:hypothetical protein
MTAESGSASSAQGSEVEALPVPHDVYALSPAGFAARGVEALPVTGASTVEALPVGKPLCGGNETASGSASSDSGVDGAMCGVGKTGSGSASSAAEIGDASEQRMPLAQLMEHSRAAVVSERERDSASERDSEGTSGDGAGKVLGNERSAEGLAARLGVTFSRRRLVLSTPPPAPGMPWGEQRLPLYISTLPPVPQKIQEKKSGILLSFVPSTEAELIECLQDPMWRVCSGQLYKIMIKSPVEGEDSTVLPFIPNRAQKRLMGRLWHRNIILKARQLGFTTLVCIMWLDHALFNHDQRCGIVAQDASAAEGFFRDKVKFAYENLPPSVRAARPLKKDSSDELLFEHNNSSIRVATSMRSGTIHRLHISEYGKICAKYPDKATEVSTGTLPAVPVDGIVIIESTAEGQDGDFFKKTQIAIANAQIGKTLTQKDFRFHFFAWWQDPTYRIETLVPMSEKDREYFDRTQIEAGTVFDQEQRNWYVSTRDADFSGDPEKMWQEYPSTAKEAFQISTEGTYYATQLAAARKAGRIGRVPYLPNIPVDTFWDIGNTDGTAIWFMQRLGYENRFIDFDEGWGEPYGYFTQRMQSKGFTWGTHYLPHDAEHARQGATSNQSPKEMLEDLMPGADFECVPRVASLIDGIQATRNLFASSWFDEEKTMLGIAHLVAYRKTWDKSKGGWKMGVPSKVEGHSEAADAYRQRAQMDMPPPKSEDRQKPRGNWKTA